MTTAVRGRPVALVGYSDEVVARVRDTAPEVRAHDEAVRAFAAAPSDLPVDLVSLGPVVAETLAALERVDSIPGAFGRALQALDDDGASRTGAAEVSDVALFEAALAAALDDEDLRGADLAEVALAAPADAAWDEFVVTWVSEASSVSTAIDSMGQLGRWGRVPITWLDLVVTESNFDATSGWTMTGRGRHVMTMADALDATADAHDAARQAVTARPSFVDDALSKVPRAGGALSVANRAIGWGGVGLGVASGVADIVEGEVVDGGVQVAGAGASALLMLGVGGPVTLGVAAGVAAGSIVYEHREAIGNAARAVGHAVGRVWPW